jgi:hypothetical protein
LYNYPLHKMDISNLSPEEIKDLEKQIKDYHNSKKAIQGYKVTFYVAYLPKLHGCGVDMLYNEEDFAEWLVNAIPDTIIDVFSLKKPEDVSGFDVVKMTKKEVNEVFGD